MLLGIENFLKYRYFMVLICNCVVDETFESQVCSSG